jgi:polysaccharide biosynthesis/export protein
MLNSTTRAVLAFVLLLLVSLPAGAAQAAPPRQGQAPASAPASEAVRPPDYVIGAEDVLGIVFWREPDMSGDVTVRPDGRITIPVIGELQAAGRQPDQLQKEITAAAAKYISGVNVVVIVRTINSRKVFVTGRVTTPGTYPLMGTLTAIQAIALAGGLTEFADPKGITILRTDNGQARTLKFNYQDVSRGKSLEQNIQLRPGDTIVVP